MAGLSINENTTTDSNSTPSATVSLDQLHPVGSWYMSDDPTSPGELFGGGSWLALEGRVLVGADSTYAVGTTGGNAEIIQTAEQVGKHIHAVRVPYKSGTDYTNFAYQTYGNWNGVDTAISGWTLENEGGAPMNIMNPYYATYIWKRVA